MKKFLALLLALVMVFALAACGEAESTPSDTPASDTPDDSTVSEAPEGGDTAAAGSVYYLNFKPEQDSQWQELAALYTEQTGVTVKVVTAASGEYETYLTSEMAKEDAPTLFQVNGPVGLASWKDYCYDLADSAIYGELTSTDYALTEGDVVYGIGYVIESYGLIVNTDLLSQAGYTVDDIQSFEDLKAVAEDITARKDELGFAAFTSAGINQTRHQIQMVLTVQVVLLLPGGTYDRTFTNKITVAESILMGDVPSHYSYFSQFDTAREAADAQRDYSAE